MAGERDPRAEDAPERDDEQEPVEDLDVEDEDSERVKGGLYGRKAGGKPLEY